MSRIEVLSKADKILSATLFLLIRRSKFLVINFSRQKPNWLRLRTETIQQLHISPFTSSASLQQLCGNLALAWDKRLSGHTLIYKACLLYTSDAADE